MPEGMNEFLWFVLGIFSYRVVASILTYGHMSIFMDDLRNNILKLLAVTMEDIVQLREHKYIIMKEVDLPEEEIQAAREADKKTLSVWKESIVARFIVHWPKYYRSLLKFDNWREAMSELKEVKK